MTVSMPPEPGGYQAHFGDVLLAAVRDGERLSDEQLEELVRDQANDAARKRLIGGLAGCGLISHEQAVFAFYLRPELKGA